MDMGIHELLDVFISVNYEIIEVLVFKLYIIYIYNSKSCVCNLSYWSLYNTLINRI